MWTLIKREMRDHWMHVVVPIIFMFFALTSIVSQALWGGHDIPVLGMSDDLLAICWIPLVIFPLLAAKLGMSQMYVDHSRKISAFLLSQPTSRSKLLVAKIIAGLIWILFVSVPFILTDVILLAIMPPLIPGGSVFLIRLMVTAVLVNLACYSIGLVNGWGTNKYVPHFIAIALSLPLLSLLVIKGFGVETWAVLILVIITALLKLCEKFMATSL